MEWELQIWERGRWCLHTLHHSYTHQLWVKEWLFDSRGIPARLVPNNSAPGLEAPLEERLWQTSKRSGSPA